MSGEPNTAGAGGRAIALSGCCAETQEEPWDVVHPVNRGAAGAEHVLEAAVEALHDKGHYKICFCIVLDYVSGKLLFCLWLLPHSSTKTFEHFFNI